MMHNLLEAITKILSNKTVSNTKIHKLLGGGGGT